MKNGLRLRDQPVVTAFRRDGTLLDLANVTAADIDFGEMADGLANIARYVKRHAGPAFSVAQHCVMGADALHRETGDAELAGYFLGHDGHEYLLGDWITPAVGLVAHHHARTIGSRGSVDNAVKVAKHNIDLAIWQAAGRRRLDGMPEYARLVADMDARMLRAEALALFGPQAAAHLPAGDRPPPRLTGAIEGWGPMKAELAFVERLERYFGIVVAR